MQVTSSRSKSSVRRRSLYRRDLRKVKNQRWANSRSCSPPSYLALAPSAPKNLQSSLLTPCTAKKGTLASLFSWRRRRGSFKYFPSPAREKTWARFFCAAELSQDQSPPPRRKTCGVLSLRLTPQKKGRKRPFFRGGEGEDRTRAPVTRPNSLANCPLDPLGTSPYSFFADSGGYFYIIPPVPPFVNTFL